MKIMIWAALICLSLCKTLSAQNSSNAAIEVIKQTMERYREPGFLSFELDCKYSPETSPYNYLDSLKGMMKISGNKYWYRMLETETVCNGDYLISIFNEEKMMNLLKLPSVKDKPVATSPIDNPVLNELDTLLREKLISLELKETSGLYIISINFLSESSYKKIEYSIDNKTKLIQKYVQVVRTAELMGPEFQSTEAGSQFAVVQTLFHHYSTERFDEAIFASDSYFSKQNDRLTPSSLYNGYKLIAPDEVSR